MRQIAAAGATTSEVFRLISNAAQHIHAGSSPRALKRKALFICRALRYRALLQKFWTRLLKVAPHGRLPVTADVVGVTEWPYLNNTWDVAERLERIARHYELLAATSSVLFALDQRTAVQVVDLARFSPGCHVIIDRPLWMKREGELVLNLFRESLRVASLAFILGTQGGEPAIFIGGLQGIHRGVSSEESLEIYRNLTKDFEGLRPKSLLLDIMQMIASGLGMKLLLAVADENRHHRHKYFGPGERTKLAANYDEAWTEHGGSRSGVCGFYQLPLSAPRRDLAEVPAKKRAMYRRRYSMLVEVEKEIAHTIESWTAGTSSAAVIRQPQSA